MVDDLSKLLSTWLERDPTTTAGLYYIDLLAIVTARKDLLRESKRLLEKWTVRDKNFTAGKYYLDLKTVYDYYVAISGSEKLLMQKPVPNFGVTVDESECRRYEPICDFDGDSKINENLESLEDYVKSKENDAGMYFSNLSITLGETENVYTNGPAKLFFSFDLSGFLYSQIKNACLLANTNREILDEFIQFVHVKSLTIERTHIDQDNSAEVIVVGSPDSNGVIKGISKKNNDITATIREIRGVQIEDTTSTDESPYTVSYYRHFSVKDNYIADQKNGEYMYSVTITIEDKTDDFIKARLSTLVSAKILLEEYYNTSLLRCSYNSETGAFTDAFLQNQYSAYEQGKSPWFLGPSAFADMLRCFYDVTDEDAYTVAAEMYTRLDPQSSSPDKILSIIKEFDIVESEIKTKFDINSRMGNPNESSPKSKSGSNISQVQYDFSDELEIVDLNNTNASEVVGSSDIIGNDQIGNIASESIGFSGPAKSIFGVS
jgi:hypothetical protein